MSAPLDLPALVRDPSTRIVVTCGSGGVGKTTTAAAIALLGAEAGRRTVVLTIDPARRLAQSMGLTELDNTPREVKGVKGGNLFAMMLDMKRTFDDVVLENSSPERAQQIFANPFYQSLSSSFAGAARILMTRPSRNDTSRFGASRKSSAERLGGVSTTIRSQSPCSTSRPRSWDSFSIAMYSWVPAKDADSDW